MKICCGTVENGDSKILANVVRSFPFLSNLQRIFMSTDTTTNMRWHDEVRIRDGTEIELAD